MLIFLTKIVYLQSKFKNSDNMSYNNILNYINIPFVFLWSLLKGGDNTRKRVVKIILGGVLFYIGIWIDIQWNKVPTYYHTIDFERIYSRDSLKKNFITVNYKLKMNGGCFSLREGADPKAFYEEIKFNYSESRKGNSYWSRNKHDEPVSFKSLTNSEIAQVLEDSCAINGVSFDFFTHGFHIVHKYVNDLGDCELSKNRVYNDITMPDSSKIVCIQYSKIFKDSILRPPFKDVVYQSYLWKTKRETPHNIFDSYCFINTPYAPAVKRNQTTVSGVFFYKLMNFFSLKDVSKSFYNISFTPSNIDSANYTICFDEAVKFSEMNVDVAQKDLYSVKFKSDYSNLVNYRNINFMVEYVESGNLQTIRIGFLTALLALPLSLIVKNIKLIFSSSSTDNSQTNHTKNQAVNKRRKRRKKTNITKTTTS